MKPILESYPLGYDEKTADPCSRLPWTLRQFFRYARQSSTASDAIAWAIKNYGVTRNSALRLWKKAKKKEQELIAQSEGAR